jgi:hypothetical protein
MNTLTNMNKIRLIGAVLVICTTAAWATCWDVMVDYDCPHSVSILTCDDSCITFGVACPGPCFTCVQASGGGGYHTCFVNTCQGQCYLLTYVYGSCNQYGQCGPLQYVLWGTGTFAFPCAVKLINPCPGQE